MRINLLPGEYEKKAAAQRRVVMVSLLAVLLAMVFMGVYFSRVAKLTALNNSIQGVDAELSRLKPVVDRVNTLSAKRTEIDRKMRVISDLMETRLFYPLFMENLAKNFPGGVWLTNLNTRGSYDEFDITMGLNARDNYAVAEFLNVLEDSPLFDKIRFTGISTITGGEDENIRVFSVSCGYVPQGEK